MIGNRIKRAWFLALLGLLGVISAAFFYLIYLFNQTEFFLPGVQIGPVPVERLSKADAIDAVDRWVNNFYSEQLVFYYNDYRYETIMGDLCLPADSRTIVEDVLFREKERAFHSKLLNIGGNKDIIYAIPISFDPGVTIRLQREWNDRFGEEAVNASLEMDRAIGLITVPAKIGREIDMDATFNGLPGEWTNKWNHQVPIVMKKKYPAINEEDLKTMGEISSYTTWYKVSEVDRSYNLALATSLINGTMIKPGGIFSYNEVVGPRTAITGFRDALVIVGDKFEPGIGGGICQVSSTLYNSCLLAGMEIVERHNHGLAVAYVPLGLDATVAYGLQDFRFKNNTDYPIYIRAVAGGGKLTVNIYGHLDYKQNIELSYVIDRIIDFIEVTEVDPELQPGEQKLDHNGFPGYHVRSFRTFKDEQGNVIETELLASDRYKPLNKLIYVAAPTTPSDPVASDPPIEPDMPEENNGQGAVNPVEDEVIGSSTPNIDN